MISGDLASRLPLRNLNWKSPSRPLRSIGALHVEFVPDAATAAAAGADVQTRLQRADSYGPRSIATAAATDTANTSLSSGKERRHQIPGLRQTPYLKIYLLRCDDKDTYKSTSRQLVREWIRENTPPPQTSSTVNKLEAHDASEWLILHVVLPDTVAASEPRWTAASKRDPDELVERPQSSAKWPGKSTSTVLDKIRADFNPSTKSVPERVAQIRLQKSDIPQHHLPQNPVPSAYIETKQEQENAWQDLFAKFKTLILMSFDLRVTQYEDDIREKDAQRSLPGWNFCTFFTLKEGLARGFESVGLVEDALAIYDELTLGLESAVTDAPDSAASRGTLLGDLDKYRDILKEISAAESDAQTIEKLIQPLQSLYDQPLDLTKKDYRGEIVKSTISLFDFHLYIFARQRTLLLRLGSGSGTIQQNRPPSSHSTQKDDNLSFPAEVCRRAAAFAATNSRALRIGLRTGYEHAQSVYPVNTPVDSFVGLTTISLLNPLFLLKTSPFLGPMPFSIKYLTKQSQISCLCPLPPSAVVWPHHLKNAARVKMGTSTSPRERTLTQPAKVLFRVVLLPRTRTTRKNARAGPPPCL